MFTRLLFIKRRSDLTPQEFRDYYENIHVPLVSSLRPIQPLIYRRNYVLRDHPLTLGLMAGREFNLSVEYDCITEVVFENAEDAAPPPPEIVQRLRQDESNFIAPDGLAIHVVQTCDQF